VCPALRFASRLNDHYSAAAAWRLPLGAGAGVSSTASAWPLLDGGVAVLPAPCCLQMAACGRARRLVIKSLRRMHVPTLTAEQHHRPCFSRRIRRGSTDPYRPSGVSHRRPQGVDVRLRGSSYCVVCGRPCASHRACRCRAVRPPGELPVHRRPLGVRRGLCCSPRCLALSGVRCLFGTGGQPCDVPKVRREIQLTHIRRGLSEQLAVDERFVVALALLLEFGDHAALSARGFLPGSGLAHTLGIIVIFRPLARLSAARLGGRGACGAGGAGDRAWPSGLPQEPRPRVASAGLVK
jgi:hypothetical protein